MLQILPLDVTKATDIEAAAKTIGGRLDLLINNVSFFSITREL
jgi:short-subunit dehydrogenase